jgi:hypothetical protein
MILDMAETESPALDGTEISPRETRHVATGLIVYGIVGVVLAIASIVALVIIDSRIGNVSDDVSVRIDTLESTIAATSASLSSAATSASGFSTTLGTTSEALTSASNVVGELSPVLQTLGRLGGLLGSAGDGFQAVGQNLADLGPSLQTLSSNLAKNQQELANTSETVQKLSGELDNVRKVLASGTIETRVSEGFGFLRAGLVAMTIWLALPAIAALFIGIWLRRAVAPST